MKENADLPAFFTLDIIHKIKKKDYKLCILTEDSLSITIVNNLNNRLRKKKQDHSLYLEVQMKGSGRLLEKF